MSDQIKVDKRVEQYIQVRTALKALETEYDEKRKPLREIQEELAGWLQSFMDKSGAKSIRTPNGTCSLSTKYTASLSDPEVFMDFVIKTGKFELMDRRANSTAVKDYVGKNSQLPPGCNLSALTTVGVRRPTKKGDGDDE